MSLDFWPVQDLVISLSLDGDAFSLTELVLNLGILNLGIFLDSQLLVREQVEAMPKG